MGYPLNLPFVPGLDLCESFYRDGVRPVMTTHFPDLSYAAGRLGRGSDVLGFDTPQSRDHHWGPKVTLFLTASDIATHRDRVLSVLAAELPKEVDGYSTHFDTPEVDGGTLAIAPPGPIHHGVTVTTLERFSQSYLGIDATRPFDDRQWMHLPAQRLRTIRAGRVFEDPHGGLRAFRERLDWYPHHVWLYRLAAAWRRIDQEEPFMARCGDVGDDLGSRLVSARLVSDLMRVVFLMEREYAPYIKWFGTAFGRLRLAPTLNPVFERVFEAPDWRRRESALNEAYLAVGEAHNALELTAPVPARLSPFFARPYVVPHAIRFVDALLHALPSDALPGWPQHIGGIDQFVDSTDVLDRIERMHTIGAAVGNA